MRKPRLVEFIYHTSFMGKNACKRILEDPEPVPSPRVDWYFRWPDESVQPKKKQLLTGTQERELFLKYNYCRWMSTRTKGKKSTNWSDWAEKFKSDIVGYNLALVVSMVMRHGIGTSHRYHDEVVSECNLRLVRAAELFDVGTGNKFSTYACRGIINHALRYAFRLKRHQEQPLGDDSYPLRDAAGSNWAAREREAVEDHQDGVQEAILAAGLNDREINVLKARFFDDPPKTLQVIGDQMGISKERVRQIQSACLKKVRRGLAPELVEVYSLRIEEKPNNG